MPKLKRLHLGRLLLYPIVINPFFWFFFLVALLYWLAFSWWTRKVSGKYVEYTKNPSKFRDRGLDVFFGFLLVFLNSVWFNAKKSRAYLEYLQAKWFPYYGKGDWRRDNNIKMKLHQYQRTKNPQNYKK